MHESHEPEETVVLFVGSAHPCDSHSYNALRVRFSATVGEADAIARSVFP